MLLFNNKADRSDFQSDHIRGALEFSNLEALRYKKYSFKTDLHACACVIYQLHHTYSLQLVDDAPQTPEFYSDLLENGYPTHLRSAHGCRIHLSDRVLSSRYATILKKMLSGDCQAKDFLSDLTVLKSMKYHHLSFDTLDIG